MLHGEVAESLGLCSVSSMPLPTREDLMTCDVISKVHDLFFSLLIQGHRVAFYRKRRDRVSWPGSTFAAAHDSGCSTHVVCAAASARLLRGCRFPAGKCIGRRIQPACSSSPA